MQTSEALSALPEWVAKALQQYARPTVTAGIEVTEHPAPTDEAPAQALESSGEALQPAPTAEARKPARKPSSKRAKKAAKKAASEAPALPPCECPMLETSDDATDDAPALPAGEWSASDEAPDPTAFYAVGLDTLTD